ncbi:MAG: 50S ribosomal protein L19 [Candidatus Pacebacteria bacterium]|jgi:large subunit ribosomal protein L19|nr:50S ribosomal protein L19 [Candidatus Paceibacterota bacterium]
MAMTLTPVNIDERKKLEFNSGDTVRVWVKIEEKGKTRTQAFEGLVLSRKHGSEIGATFTVRKVSNSVGVERIFSLYSPLIDKIEVVKKSRARRSKLYYIRDKAAREVKRKMKAVTIGASKMEEVDVPAEEVVNTEE